MIAQYTLRTFLLAALVVGSVGCDEIVGALGLQTGARKLSDDDAFTHLRSNYQEAPSTDVAAIKAIADEQVDKKIAKKARRKASEQSDDVISLKRRVIHTRKTINPEGYTNGAIKPEMGPKIRAANKARKAVCNGGDPYTVSNLSELGSNVDYLIPNADKIPVRDQGGRGTCAAFTGVGAVEYSALRGPSAGLPTMDLSEQRFYYISKPESQETGGTSEGSWYGTGFDESENASDLDIPLETDCPYNSTLDYSNDLQVPQKKSCENGSVKVEAQEYWCGVDGLIDMLDRGYAVPFASVLTDNWYNSDGVITKAGIGNGAVDAHAGGHAYLVVGYRTKGISKSEGGICFWVKNSWGTGWGINGYACQTLAWLKAVDEAGYAILETENPVPTGIQVTSSLQGNELPPDNESAEDTDTSTDVIPDNGSQDDDALPPDNENHEDEEAEKLEPNEEDYAEVNLLGSTEKYLRAESAQVSTADTDYLFIRGLLRNDGGTTTPVVVQKNGSKLYYDGDQVGQVTSEAITLCAGEWAPLCSLRYKNDGKKMYIQFRDDDLRAVKDSELTSDKGEWYDVSFATDEEYGLFVPKAEDALLDLLVDPKVYIKLGSSQASRLSLRATAWNKLDIRIQGETVGELVLTSPLDSSLCSGKYSDTCEIIGKDQLSIFPSNEK